MALLRNNHLKASSLIEVVVAMVILSVTFTVCLMVFNNITRSTYSLRQMKYSLILQNLKLKTEQEKSYFDEVISEENEIVYKKVSHYNNRENLILLEFEVVDAGNEVIAERKDLIYLITDDEN